MLEVTIILVLLLMTTNTMDYTDLTEVHSNGLTFVGYLDIQVVSHASLVTVVNSVTLYPRSDPYEIWRT